MLDDGFDGHGAGDFAVGLAAHAVGKDVEVEGGLDVECVFVVLAHATEVGARAGVNQQENSGRGLGGTPRSEANKSGCRAAMAFG